MIELVTGAREIVIRLTPAPIVGGSQKLDVKFPPESPPVELLAMLHAGLGIAIQLVAQIEGVQTQSAPEGVILK